MENQRLLLVIALLFVLFLIWQNWIEFQARKSPPPSVVTAPETSETAPEGGVQSQQDVPSQDVPSAPTPSATQAPGPALSSGQRIRVITDLFEAEIDTLGGDLRHVGLRTYSESLQRKDKPFSVLQDNRAELFIIQSGLVSDTGPAPNHYVRYVPEQTEYRLKAGADRLEVPLVWTDESGLKVIKTYTFYRDRFVIELAHRLENGTATDWRGSQYRQLQRTPPQQKRSWLGGVYTYTGGVISTPDEPYEKVSFDDMTKGDLSQTVLGGWVAMIQHYFLAALVPKQDLTDIFYTKVIDGNRFVLGMLGQQQTLAPGESGTFATQLYVGPKIQDRLEEVAPNLRLTVDYGFLTIIAQPLFWLLKMIHRIVGNWGWAIIVLTILIKAAFFKLSETSYKSMANMRRLAPKMASLKERYGDDRQRMNQAMMDLYKKEKINPLGGCLPIVVQIPVFIALYWMLLESVELRQAPFMLWIQDLSVKDPYYVLPIIMGVTMFIQQKLNPPPPDPMQAKVMMALPFVFTFFFLFFPAGLVLYWVVNNVLSIAQQYVITKRVEQSPVKT